MCPKFLQLADNKNNMSEDQIKKTIKSLATTFGRPIRSPILRWPHEYGLEYEDVFFPSIDGIPLEAWFIPAERRPNGWSGCEDPRITFFEPLQRYVMTYTALSSQGPRIALALSEDLFS